MLNIIQKILSEKNPMIAPFSADELTGKQKGFLYSRKSKIESKFDFYCIKFATVYSVNTYYGYCSFDEHKKLKSLVNDSKKLPSPKEYFEISKYWGLNPDYTTYRNVIDVWMKSNNYFFYEDIDANALPDGLPNAFIRIAGDVINETYRKLENAESADEGMVYADLFTINNKVCLLTGAGKSDACKVIADSEGAYDQICYRKGPSGLECYLPSEHCFLPVNYCIHMDSINIGGIKEVDCYEYLQKAQGNITYFGTSLPSFYQLLKCSNCKKILVPYTDTLELKSQMLKEYLC